MFVRLHISYNSMHHEHLLTLFTDHDWLIIGEKYISCTAYFLCILYGSVPAPVPWESALQVHEKMKKIK